MLDEEGLAKNTIIVYVSDQGYFLGEHGMFDKRMMYEEPLHMPFVIRYPKEIPAGTRNKDIILNVVSPPHLPITQVSRHRKNHREKVSVRT